MRQGGKVRIKACRHLCIAKVMSDLGEGVLVDLRGKRQEFIFPQQLG